MKLGRSNIIERVEFLKAVARLHKSGVDNKEIARQLGVRQYVIEHAIGKLNFQMRDVMLVDGLSDAQIKETLSRYLQGVPMADIIAGDALGYIGVLYFCALHVNGEHDYVRKLNVARLGLEAKIVAKQTSWGQFEDEPNVPKAVIAAVWGNSRNTIGSAAGMCAEAGTA
jgi:hypothetical protein